MGFASYEHIKLGAEIIAFTALTLVVVLFFKIRPWLRRTFTESNVRNLAIGVLIFWAGYLVNVMNDVVKTEFMKVFDDVLVAVGLAWVLFALRPFYWEVKIRIEPTKVVNGTKSIESGAYLVRPEALLEGIHQLLGGFKVIAAARKPELFRKYGIPVLWITTVNGENTIEPTRLAPLLHYLVQRADQDTVVVLEGVEYLILENGFETFFKFLTALKDNITAKGASLIVVLDPKSLTEKELKLLERELTWLF